MYILETTVLPINEKIKAIRKFLRINQQQLAGSDIDRSLISYIENGKIKLTKDTASVLAKNFKKIIEEKDLGVEVDDNYLLSDEEGQVAYILDTHIKRLKDFSQNNHEKFERELNKAEHLMHIWDIPSRKAVIYEIAGDYFYNKEIINKSRIHYLMSVENYIRVFDRNHIARVDTKLARCALLKNDYEEVVNLNNHALSLLSSNGIENPSLKKRVLFNNAFSYYKMKKYSEALIDLDELVADFEDLAPGQHFDILVLKGNIYAHQREFNKAIQNFETLLDFGKQEDNQEVIALAYKNLSGIYYEIKEIEKSLDYEKRSLEIREKINSEYLISNLKTLAERYAKFREYNLSEKYLLKALQIAEGKENQEIIIEVYEKILDILGDTDKDDIIERITEKISGLVDLDEVTVAAENVFMKLCKYYLDKDTDKTKQLLEMGIRFNENKKGKLISDLELRR